MKRFASDHSVQSCRYLGLLIVLTLFLTPLRAQKPEKGSWENLNQLRIGQKIEVVQVNFKSQTGKFLGLSEEAISFRTKETEVSVAREDVLRVTLRENSKRLRNTLLGLAIGGGAGFAIGAATDTSTETGEHLGVWLGGLVGLGGGAGIGAAIPSFQTVYRAKAK